jgi:hypothetical protein
LGNIIVTVSFDDLPASAILSVLPVGIRQRSVFIEIESAASKWKFIDIAADSNSFYIPDMPLTQYPAVITFEKILAATQKEKGGKDEQKCKNSFHDKNVSSAKFRTFYKCRKWFRYELTKLYGPVLFPFQLLFSLLQF